MLRRSARTAKAASTAAATAATTAPRVKASPPASPTPRRKRAKVDVATVVAAVDTAAATTTAGVKEEPASPTQYLEGSPHKGKRGKGASVARKPKTGGGGGGGGGRQVTAGGTPRHPIPPSVQCSDGLFRCWHIDKHPAMLGYHDREWGHTLTTGGSRCRRVTGTRQRGCTPVRGQRPPCTRSSSCSRCKAA
jgi:hypothetical protein